MWKHLVFVCVVAVLATACESSGTTEKFSPSIPDGGAQPPSSVDAQPAAVSDSGPQETYRTSLSVCWTDSSCNRALAVGHGGLWNTSDVPYDSNAALEAAYALGADAVKIDVRVTADNVPVIAHSSPIELFESLDCYNKKIEEMTAAEVTECHRAPSSTETFQRLDDVLGYLRGKMVAQLTVKEPTDYARAIEEVIALGAEDMAFIEISLEDLQTLIPTLPGWESVYYLINIESELDEVDQLIAENNPRAFMAEFDPDIQLGGAVAELHAAGIRTFTYEDAKLADKGDFVDLFEAGYDVVSANYEDVVDARIEVNESRGISPP